MLRCVCVCVCVCVYASVCVRKACMWLSGRSSIVREIGSECMCQHECGWQQPRCEVRRSL